MKPVKASFGISILLLLHISLLCTAQDTFYVTPSVSESACEGRDPCNTLSGYTVVTQNGPFDSIPNSSVTLIFLPGSHLIADISVVISGIASFTMAGDPDSRTEINCTESLRFGFVDIGEVSISDLTFLSCGLDVTTVGLFELSSSSVLDHTLRSAVNITSSSVIAIRSCNFSGNSGGLGDGGVVSIISSSVGLTSANFSDNTFSNNTAGVLGPGGGGVFIISVTAVFSGTNVFANNFARFGGGVSALNSVTTFSGTNMFIGNRAMQGGALKFSGLLDINGNTTFEGNQVVRSGGGIFINESSSLSAQGVITLVDNVARLGGGIYVQSNSSAHFRGSILFRGQTATVFGGAIAGIGCNISFDGETTIEDNSAMYGGGIGSLDSMVTLNGSTSINRNVGGGLGGGILAVSSTIVFTGEAEILLNMADQDGGGCILSRSILSIAGNMTFDNNEAEFNGGGMILSGDSEIVFQPMTELRFTNNCARRGGAIVIVDSVGFLYCTPMEIPDFSATKCFYQFPSYRLEELPPTDVAIFFEMNNASEAGADFYGGLVDSCYLEVEGNEFNQQSGQPSFAAVFHGGESLKVSSIPIRVCVCQGEIANCSIESVNRHVFPGGMVEVFVVALGQRNGTVPALVQAEVAEGKDQQAQIARLEASQPIKNTCSSLKYTVLTAAENSTVTIQMYPRDGPCPLFVRNVSIVAEILLCPVGFEFSESEQACVCDNRLVEEGFTTVCNISDQIIHRDGDFWMGFDSELILFPHCPFDFCITEAIDVPIVNGNVQCDNNRAGHICGQCSDGFSLSLGSSKCTPCTNAYLALLIVFIVAGIALVIFLLVFKLTVFEGTMNALVFYANIVHVNEAIFFPPGNRNFLRGFIAWINLDLGIETCFYDGMDAYAKAWLQFVFPVYVWTLVFVFITVGRFSPRVAKMLGSNPVTVLATLFLLSYNKVLRAIIVPLCFAELSLADSSKAVWIADGNVEYFQGRHIPLFLFSVAVFLFKFLPYTFLLFFGQWIQQLKICRWMNGTRFRAFLDAYWAPYTPKHRYWTGLLLLLRCILFLVNALCNARNDSSFNLIIIGCVCLGLAVVSWMNCRIYKKWYLQVLEASFILNLGVLSVASVYIIEVRRNETAETILVSFSAGIAFVEFIGIIIFHGVKQLSKTAFWSRTITYYLSTTTWKNSRSKDAPGNATGVSEPNSGNITFTSLPAWSELQISRLEAQSSQLREPFLEDVL